MTGKRSRGCPPCVFVRALRAAEGRRLSEILRRGTADYVTVRRAQIVLASAQGASAPEIAEAGISYQRLKTWKGSPDPHYEGKKNRVLRVRRQARRGVPVVALDGLGPVSLQPWPGQGWFPGRTPALRLSSDRH